jgi:hypothetical protein
MSAPDDKVGRKVNCLKCGQQLRIPAPPNGDQGTPSATSEPDMQAIEDELALSGIVPDDYLIPGQSDHEETEDSSEQPRCTPSSPPQSPNDPSDFDDLDDYAGMPRRQNDNAKLQLLLLAAVCGSLGLLTIFAGILLGWMGSLCWAGMGLLLLACVPLFVVESGSKKGCPQCGRWWASQLVDSELVDVDTYNTTRDITRTDRHYDVNGKPTGRTERDETVQVRVTYQTHRLSYKCKYCQHEWNMYKVTEK